MNPSEKVIIGIGVVGALTGGILLLRKPIETQISKTTGAVLSVKAPELVKPQSAIMIQVTLSKITPLSGQTITLYEIESPYPTGSFNQPSIGKTMVYKYDEKTNNEGIATFNTTVTVAGEYTFYAKGAGATSNNAYVLAGLPP